VGVSALFPARFGPVCREVDRFSARAILLGMRLAFACLFALALACSSGPESPEDRVRATVAAIEAAAGARDAGELGEQISESYKDARGNTKKDVLGVVTLHLMRNQKVYTLSRILSIELAEPDRAQVRVLAALAGSPIPDPSALAGLRADLYEFDATLREEQPGTWRVTAADWHPATLADFE